MKHDTLMSMIIREMKAMNQIIPDVNKIRTAAWGSRLDGMLRSLQILGHDVEVGYNPEGTKYMTLRVDDLMFCINEKR